MSTLDIFRIILESGTNIWITFCLLVALYFIYLKVHYAGTPPGPWGLPVFGYFPFISREPHKDMTRLARKYGDVFSVKLGSRYVIILNNYETLHETLLKEGEIYNGKPLEGLAKEFGDYKTLFVTDGKSAHDQRSFLLSSLRDIGFGKKRMEEHIQEEAKTIIDEFLKRKGETLNFKDIIACGVTNIISYLVFGQRFNYDDKEIMKNLQLLSEVLSTASQFSLLESFPILQNASILNFFGMAKFQKLKQEIYHFIDLKLSEHKKSFDANNIRDLLDMYILKSNQVAANDKISDENIFTDEFTRPNALLLFGAGSDTTAATLCWAFKLLALNPDIQTRIQQEIDDVIGRERPPAMSDKTKMPFTEATLLEIDRFVSHIPFTFYHRITSDTILRDYKIPKNSFVLANLWSVHYSIDIWDNPSQFNPHRFLDDDGKVSKLRQYVIPFSIGKRNCLGESLARSEIFLFLTSFLQKLNFLPSKGDANLDTSTETPSRKLKSCYLSIQPRD